MTMTAKVFSTGNSQAVCLPKAFRLNIRAMWIARNEHSVETTLSPKPDADAPRAHPLANGAEWRRK